MTATSAPARTLERVHQPPAHHRAPRRHRTLEVEVVAGGDPVRFARILSALVNNSPMALARVSVGDQDAYPVPSAVPPRRGPMVLTLRLRNQQQHIDSLLVAEVVEIISSMCQVVDTRRRP